MCIVSKVKEFHSNWLRPFEVMAEDEGNVAMLLNMDNLMNEIPDIKYRYV